MICPCGASWDDWYGAGARIWCGCGRIWLHNKLRRIDDADPGDEDDGAKKDKERR